MPEIIYAINKNDVTGPDDRGKECCEEPMAGKFHNLRRGDYGAATKYHKICDFISAKFHHANLMIWILVWQYFNCILYDVNNI